MTWTEMPWGPFESLNKQDKNQSSANPQIFHLFNTNTCKVKMCSSRCFQRLGTKITLSTIYAIVSKSISFPMENSYVTIAARSFGHTEKCMPQLFPMFAIAKTADEK
jgi:hypothetical protein